MRRAFHVDWRIADLAAVDEAQVERDILRYLQLRGYWTLQTHSGKRRPVRPGVLDISFAKGAIWGCIEVKAEDGILSDKQIEEMKSVQRAGGIAIEARSVQDVADAIDAAQGEKTLVMLKGETIADAIERARKRK